MRKSLLTAILLAIFWSGVPALGQEQPATNSVPSAAAATGPAAAESFPEVQVTEEMRAHQRWNDVIYFVGVGYTLLALLAILGLGISKRLRVVAEFISARSFVRGMVYFALFLGVLTVISLPFDWLSGFWVPHRFDLSDQSLGAWLWDAAKGLGIGIVIGAPLVALVLGGIRRVRRWWFAVWLGSVPVILFLMLIGPVVLDPVFNEFKPLEDQTLRQELLDLASRAGIQGGRVYQVDKSKQTKTMNAYVNGIGPSKRIVLWDTIIAKMDNDELLFVMAHEMGHYVLHHIWKGLAFLLTLMLGVFWAGQRVVEWATRRWGRSWGFATPDDPADVPLSCSRSSCSASSCSHRCSTSTRARSSTSRTSSPSNSPISTTPVRALSSSSPRTPRSYPTRARSSVSGATRIPPWPSASNCVAPTGRGRRASPTGRGAARSSAGEQRGSMSARSPRQQRRLIRASSSLQEGP